ncbi:MAG: hypothetical protein JOY82_18175 [Streptosporangiaceae bacterium]|nr:hypothetical protein [Streptosporangiaceae bacterium]MBV9856414.1 hypothetical protein [Streptosporangiaceae bacterium]
MAADFPEHRTPEHMEHVTRRVVLKRAGALAVALGALEAVGPFSYLPQRAIAATAPSDIQFDISAFLSVPPQTYGSGVQFQMPPVHTVFLTATLQGTPTKAGQSAVSRAVEVLEKYYPWSAAQLVTFVAYGLPYFARLPGGLTGSLVSSHMPRLASDSSRYVLEEAKPGPTDVSPANPGISKLRYTVNVAIEQNDMLFMLRSDDPNILADAVAWLGGSDKLRGQAVASPAFGGLLQFTSSRHMFIQMGLPKSLAQQNGLPFANFIQHQSPMWMGFADQQVNGSGPAAICTFAGNSSAHLTTAKTGDYFDNGAVQHLSHVILDMLQFFDMSSATSPPGTDGVFTERVQYMFHAPNIAPGSTDQYTDGGGPSLLPNDNRGTGYAARTAQGIGTNNGEHRMGHLSCLQRTSRAADGTPIHLRMDGPGLDSMDVPGGATVPKLQFTVFVPSADFFATMRTSQASLDLQQKYGVSPTDNGLERFITATRRQNFLIPPRRHRAFPLVELA